MDLAPLTHLIQLNPDHNQKRKGRLLKGMIVLILAFVLNPLFAAEKFVGGGGNALFTNAANWDDGALPNAGDDIEIKANCVFDQSGAIAYGDLTIKDGAVLSFMTGLEVLFIEKIKGSTGTLDMSNGGILKLSKSWEANPGNLTFIPGTGTIHFVNTGGNEDLADGYSDFHSIIIECASQKVNLKNEIALTGDLTIISGTLDANNWLISLAGDWSNQGGSFVEGSGQVTMTGCGQVVSSATVPDQFYNLSIANCNCVSFATDMEITGTFTSGSGGLCSHILSANETNFTGVDWQTSGNTLDGPEDFIGSINDADLKLRTNNEERMVITSDGDVGIGTMNPEARLDVEGSARVRDIVQDNALEQILVQDADGNLKYKEQSAITDPLNAAIAAEEARALIAEATLKADIDQNEADSDNADAALQSALDAEVIRATTAETTNANGIANNAAAIADEEARATAAEDALQQAIDLVESDGTANAAAIAAEQARAEAAEAALQSDIDQNEADSDAADAALQSALDAEVIRATTAETTNANGIANNAAAIADEEARATAAEDALQQAIDLVESDGTANAAAIAAEEARAEAAEAAIQTDVDQNEADSDAADAALQTALDAEVVRATTAETTNANGIANNAAAIADEEARAIAAEDALQQAIDLVESDGTANAAAIAAEEARAEAAEAAIQTDVDQNEADSDAADAALQSALDAEVIRATTAETTNANGIANNAAAIADEEARAIAAEDALQQAIDLVESDGTANAAAIAAEQARAEAAEAALQSDVDQNESDSDAADTALQSALDAEVIRATGAETANANAIQDHISADGDLDATNELQALSYDPVTQILTLENGGTVDLTSLANVAEVDPKINMTAVNKAAMWDGNQLVNGTISMVETTASGDVSTAIGIGTQATGIAATAIGLDNVASGIAAFSFGSSTLASGDYALATGRFSGASGPTATAMGYYTSASGAGATAMGRQTDSWGEASTAMGWFTGAGGHAATAMGDNTRAYADVSTAMGFNTTAIGWASTSMGAATLAQAYASVAMGRFNVISGNGNEWVETDPIFEIGIGLNNESRANAMTVLKNGNTGLGTHTPEATLDVEGTLRYADGTEGENKVLTSDAGGNATWQELVDEVNDADADPINELQALSYDPVTQILTLENGGTVDLSQLANASEVDPKVGNLSTSKVPRWNGSELADGLIEDDGNQVSITNDALVNGITIGRGSGGGTENTAIGTSALSSNTSGWGAVAVGKDALAKNTGAYGNTAVGWEALKENTGIGNTALGMVSLQQNTTGGENVAIGYASLLNNTTGAWNTALGANTLQNNTGGESNVAIGRNSLLSNTTGWGNIGVGIGALEYGNGSANIAVGGGSMRLNQSGWDNIAIGNNTLFSNNTGYWNTAMGNGSLYSNEHGTGNVAMGRQSLYLNTNGGYNSVFGYESMYNNTEGSDNVAMGTFSLYNNTTGSYNTALGQSALIDNTTGSNNTAIGWGANVESGDLDNATAIGTNAKVATSNSLVLGAHNINVGIGTSSPDAKLHVEGGSIKIVDGTQADGKVLTSDAYGNASWQDPAVAAETDPLFIASPSAGITQPEIDNWNAAEANAIAHSDGEDGIQNLAIANNTNNIITHISLDGDLDATNELQELAINGDVLSISQGNQIIIPGLSLIGNLIPSHVQNRLNNGESPLSIYTSDNTLLDSLLGKSYGGGMIFYFNPSTGAGLTASPEVISGPWGCYPDANGQYPIDGADGTTIGTGEQNTLDIVAGCPAPGIAADLCLQYSYGGFDDWFLPSYGEMNQYRNVLVSLGVTWVWNSYYWSSSEVNVWNAFRMNIKDGAWQGQNRSMNANIIPVREFAADESPIALHLAADEDLSATNELNTSVVLNGTMLEVTDAGGTLTADLSSLQDADADPANEIQDLSLTNNILTLTDGSTSVDLSPYLDNTDDQLLSYDAQNQILTLENGGTVDLSALNNVNETDPLFSVSPSATISQQDIDNWNAAEDNANLASFNADQIQNISISENAANIQNHIAADGDLDASNEFNTTAILNGSSLEITDGGGTLSVDLSTIANGVATETDPEVGINTTNYIPKWDGSALITGSIVDMDGKIGIGTENPVGDLEVISSTVNGATSNFTSNGSGYQWVLNLNEVCQTYTSPFSGYLGNVLIYIKKNASSTSTILQVKHNETILGSHTINIYPNSYTNVYFDFPEGQVWLEHGENYEFILTGGVEGTVISSLNPYPSGSRCGFPEQDIYFSVFMHPGSINPPATTLAVVDGEVGIGTSAPTESLDVNGTVRIRSLPTGNALNNILAADGNGRLHKRDLSTIKQWSENVNGIYFNAGNVGIGTNPSVSSHKLSVQGNTQITGSLSTSGDISGNNLYANNNIGASTINTSGNITSGGDLVVNGHDIWNVEAIGSDYNSATTDYFTLQLDVNNGGGVAILPHATNWGSLGRSWRYWDDAYISEIYRDSEFFLSDSRVKQNVKNVSRALELVKKLRGVTYDINTDVHPFYKDAKRDELEFAKGQMGFIAQELKEVFPEMVVMNEETGFNMVRNYEQLFPVVVEAIKEQQQQIEDLKDQVAEKTDVEAELQSLRDHNARQDALITELLQAMQKKDAQIDAMMDRMNQFDSDLQHCCLAHSGGDQTVTPTDNDQPHLAQNVPNPYSQETIIKYYLPKASKNARIRVTDMNGRLMLSYDLLETGYGEIKVEAFSLLAGTYVYELIIDDQRIDTKKMVVQN